MKSIKNAYLDIRGKIAVKDDGQDTYTLYVSQRTWPRLGNRRTSNQNANQLRRHIEYSQANTDAQVAARLVFKAAVAAWQAMSYQERRQWFELAEGLQKSGYNLFVADYVRQHKGD